MHSVCVCMRVCVYVCVCVCVDLCTFISVYIPVATAVDARQFYHEGFLCDLWSEPPHVTVFLSG